MTDFLTNADHWRKRAERTRAIAATAIKDQGRLLKVAEEYDRLAVLAEGRRGALVPAGIYAASSQPEESAAIKKVSAWNRRSRVHARAFGN